MIRPLLKSGGKIGVMAPSSYVEREDIEKSTALMEARGYKVFIHPQTFERHHQSAGTLLQKSMAFQGLWQREDIDAIWCAGGGNRALQLLTSINFEKIKRKPKPLIGFSDVTALLNAVHAHTGFITYHGPVFKQIHKIESDQLGQTLALLEGAKAPIPMNNAKILREGKASGPLLGGNLSLFQYLAESKDCADLTGAVLFLEDAGDHLSRIDRMFLQLKRLGVFEKIGALVLGEFLDMQDGMRPFGFTLEELVDEYLEDLQIPAVLNIPFGHGRNLYTLPLGAQATLIADKGKVTLDF